METARPLGMKETGETENRKTNLAQNQHEVPEIQRACAFIDEHLSEPLSLRRIAAAAGLCPTYLSERFKEVTGENLVRYIARARIRRACELIQQPEYRVKEIAYGVGFQSISQFNRSFRKLCGHSPIEVRAADGCALALH
jgi:AraC-like DNA-binding protein